MPNPRSESCAAPREHPQSAPSPVGGTGSGVCVVFFIFSSSFARSFAHRSSGHRSSAFLPHFDSLTRIHPSQWSRSRSRPRCLFYISREYPCDCRFCTAPPFTAWPNQAEMQICPLEFVSGGFALATYGACLPVRAA